MTEIIITADLNQDDWLALQRAAQARVQAAAGTRWWAVVVYFLGTLGVLLAAHWFHIHFSFGSFIGGLLVAWLTFWYLQRRAQRAYNPHQHGLFLGNCTFIFNNNGIESLRDHSGTRVGWRHVLEVTATETHVFVWLDTSSAFCIPARYLPMHVVDLMAHIGQWRSQSDATRPRGWRESTPVVTALVAPGSPWRTLTYWWQLRHAPQLRLPFSAIPSVLLILISLGLYGLGDWLRAGTSAQFYAFYLPVLAVHGLFLLGVTRLLMASAPTPLPFAHVLFVLCGALPVLSVVWVALYRAPDPRWLMIGMAVVATYTGAYIARALSQLVGRMPWITLGGALGLALAYGMLMAGSQWELRFWYPPTDSADEYATETTDATWSQGEALLFSQPARLDAALNNISTSASKTPQLFFVGFAGVAEQKVFAEEIKLAGRVITARYHAEQQQLHLINDRRNLTAQPLATVSNLRYALKGLANKMNRDHDILFLALSSHGTDEPQLQVSNGVLPLQPLTGDALKQALDDAGISWRVLVISACHAGAFIKPLMNPRTILITAAAADRTSFGCSDDRDLTYFGEAFYRDALPNSANLQQAFDNAKVIIAARENKEGMKPSDPQAYFGSEISAHLKN